MANVNPRTVPPPRKLTTVVREQMEHLPNTQEGGLLAGYCEMNKDREREASAQEWCEGLTSDATFKRDDAG
jgi:hypothetical protein